MTDLQITYLGTNTLLITKEESAILVDPHFTRPSIRQLLGKIRPDTQQVTRGLSAAGISRLDAVLLTHTHYDHALDAAEVIRQVGGILYGSAAASQLAEGAGLDDHRFVLAAPGQAFTLGSLQVIFHRAQHVPFPAPLGWLMTLEGQIKQPLRPPAWFWQYQCGSTYAIQVEHTLIFGSAGFMPGAYADSGIEIVILGIGGLDVKNRAYRQQFYQEAVLKPGAKQVLLTHWDNFFRPIESNLKPMHLTRHSIAQIKALGAQYGQSVQRLEYSQSLTVK